MKRIKIVVGTYGYLKDGVPPVKLIDKDSDPIEVSDAEAERLIGLGVATEVTETEAVEVEAEAEMATGHLDAESLQDYTVPELKALAKDLGLKTGGTKDELIERIAATEVEYPVVDEDAETDEEPPILEAADPE